MGGLCLWYALPGFLPRDAEASLGKIQGRLKLEARMWFRSSSAAAEPACDISNERKWRLVYRVLTQSAFSAGARDPARIHRH
jgi:hypothetical protein